MNQSEEPGVELPVEELASFRDTWPSALPTAPRRRRARPCPSLALRVPGPRLLGALAATLLAAALTAAPNVALGVLPASLVQGGPVSSAPAGEARVRSDPQPSPTREADPLVDALARLEPAGRIDDRTGSIGEWPLVAVDPETLPEALPPAPEAARVEAGEVHIVKEGETLLGIATALGVDEDQLAFANGLADRHFLSVGQRLTIPPRPGEGPRAVVSSRGATLRPRFTWPVRGDITTYYGEQGMLWIGGSHTGLDIAGREGEPLQAAEAGTVLEAGWSEGRGIGLYVLIDHGLGYRTLYGHLSATLVEAGQEVRRGERIGDVGNTGVSTGPHLHFEVQIEGRAVDPLAFLP